MRFEAVYITVNVASLPRSMDRLTVSSICLERVWEQGDDDKEIEGICQYPPRAASLLIQTDWVGMGDTLVRCCSFVLLPTAVGLVWCETLPETRESSLLLRSENRRCS